MAEPSSNAPLTRAFAELKRANAAKTLPADTLAGIGDKLAARTRRRRRLWIASLAVSAAALAGVVWTVPWRPAKPRIAPGFDLVTASADLEWRQGTDGALEVTRGSATLRVPELGTALVLAGGTRVRHESSGVRLLAGTARFTVESRHAAAPVRVLVSRGAIEVVGTRFAVTEREGRGSVTVESGVVRFVTDTDATYPVRAGETFGWPGDVVAPPSERPASEPAQSPAPPARASKKGSPSHRDLFADMEALRIRHEYGRLRTRIEEALALAPGEPDRERLSFELCDVLAKHGKSPKGACVVIARHLREYPHGDYSDIVRGMQDELGCGR